MGIPVPALGWTPSDETTVLLGPKKVRPPVTGALIVTEEEVSWDRIRSVGRSRPRSVNTVYR